MKPKYEISTSTFFKTWTCGKHRILKDGADTSYYSYQVQIFDGKHWFTNASYHTLQAAKEAVTTMKYMEVA